MLRSYFQSLRGPTCQIIQDQTSAIKSEQTVGVGEYMDESIKWTCSATHVIINYRSVGSLVTDRLNQARPSLLALVEGEAV